MAGIFGSITSPLQGNAYFTGPEGFFLFLSNMFKLAGVIAGLFVLVQIITAGYLYISAAGDPKKFEQAGNKILHAILGLIIVSAAFVIATVIGKLFGLDVTNPVLYGPSGASN